MFETLTFEKFSDSNHFNGLDIGSDEGVCDWCLANISVQTETELEEREPVLIRWPPSVWLSLCHLLEI